MNSFNELLEHHGHDVRCVAYGDDDDIYNVALECETCGCVLRDYDNPNNGVLARWEDD